MKWKDFLAENKKVIGLILAWLVMVNFFALIALNRFNLKSDDAYPWIPVDRYTQDQSWDIVKLHGQIYLDNAFHFTNDA